MITLTEKAEEHILSQITQRGKGLGIRFGVTGAGCGGYSYVVEFADTKNPDDVEFIQNEVTIVVDPKSLLLLDGLEVDFVTNGFNSGMEFKNPQATSCGCGESFSI